MRHIVEALEKLTASLNGIDPGDLAAVAVLLSERDRWIAALRAETENGFTGQDGEELLRRLRAIAAGSARPYRAMTLQRILIQQQVAKLQQQETMLRAFDPDAGASHTGGLLRTCL